MPRLIRFDRIGGPDVLQWVEADLPPPAAGESCFSIFLLLDQRHTLHVTIVTSRYSSAHCP